MKGEGEGSKEVKRKEGVVKVEKASNSLGELCQETMAWVTCLGVIILNFS